MPFGGQTFDLEAVLVASHPKEFRFHGRGGGHEGVTDNWFLFRFQGGFWS